MQSQISVHQEQPTASARRTVEAGCKVLKLVSDFGLSFDIASGKIKPGNPNLIIVGRMVSAFNAHDQKGENPIDAAVKFVNSQKLTYSLNPHIKIWEGHNEFNPLNIEEVSWWARFESARVELMQQIGLRCVIGNFSTGVPDVDWWDAFVPALVACDEGRGWVGIHEYIAGQMIAPNGSIREPENLLRHEPIHARVFAPNGIKSHMIATEFGCLGYRAIYSNGQDYARHIITVDAHVSQTAYFDGMCVFTHGHFSDAWKDYDVEGDEGYIEETTNHIQAHVNDSSIPVPPPPPPPEPTTPPSTRFAVGDTYEVIADPRVRVRAIPAGAFVRWADKGEQGLIVDGPRVVRLGTQMLNWWKVADGWIAESQSGVDYLKRVEVQRVNLLDNSSFEDGYYHWHNVRELAIPNSWDFWYQGDVNVRLERQDDPFFPPECVNWNRNQAPEDEKNLLFIDGNFNEKVFKGWGPIWWRLSQTVHGLTIGKRYRFVAPVFPDLVMRYDDGRKVWADDPLAGEIRLTAGESDSGWLDGNSFPFGQYTHHQLDFIATAESAIVTLECRGRWGLIENGFFIDGLSLEQID